MSRWARFKSRRRRGTSKYEVVEDAYDVRLPLHNDDVFKHGITFPVKFIGCLQVPRPSSRLEIITSMRKIRYEFKMKRMKKQRVNVFISQEGVKTTKRFPLRRRRQLIRRRPQQQLLETTGQVIMEHTIFKVFYVSHDSQDLKIFSYIARDGPENTFKCYVFKAKKKSQALRVVRTMGQAFEVVHKIQKQKESNKAKEETINNSETTIEPTASPSQEQLESESVEKIDTKEDNQNESKCKFDEGLGGSETLVDTSSPDSNEPITGSPAPSGFSLNGPIATSSPEPSQALTQHNQAMQKMIQQLRTQLEREVQTRLETNKQNTLLMEQNKQLAEQLKMLKKEMDTLKISTISKVIGNSTNNIIPYVTTPGTPPSSNHSVSLLDVPNPPVEDTLVPLAKPFQNWEHFDDDAK